MTKEQRIAEELARLSDLFEGVDANQKANAAPLLQNASFMKVTLEDLQDQINAEGVTEVYQNGANQHGVKQSATLQSYNALIKNYASVVKSLSQLLPPERKKIVYEPPKVHELTPEERREREEAERRRIDAEIARAVEYQRQQREQERAKQGAVI